MQERRRRTNRYLEQITAEALQRFERHGGSDISDIEMLELAILVADPTADANLVAHHLLDRFGIYSNVLSAGHDLLLEVPGVNLAMAARLKMIRYAAERFARDKLRERKIVLSSSRALLEYCRTAMAFEAVEQLRVLYLDRKNSLISNEVHAFGDVRHVDVQQSEILRRAVVLRSTAVILVHNHPSGDPAPSS